MLSCLYFSFFLDIFRYKNVLSNCEFTEHRLIVSDALLGGLSVIILTHVPKNLGYFDSRDRLGEFCVLYQGVQHLQSYLYSGRPTIVNTVLKRDFGLQTEE